MMGKRESKIEIVKNMLKKKIPENVISEVTNLSKQEILKIKKNT